MRNVFCFIITIALFGQCSAQKKVSLLNLPGKEIAFFPEIKEDLSFKKYFIFQYEGTQPEIFDYLKANTIILLENKKDFIKIKSDERIVTFTLNQEYKNSNETIYYGYGLSERLGDFKLKMSFEPINNVSSLILTNGLSSSGKNKCHSGGVGSSECSVTPHDLSVGTPSCSVKCNQGYYSCCDDTKGECNCVAEKPKSTGPVKPMDHSKVQK